MSPQTTRAIDAIDAIRYLVAFLIFVHGAARLAFGGVPPFGAWLETQGFPLGVWFAGAVTGYELIAPVMIALGRYVTLACLGHIFILTLGMFMVHAPAGWFVVGLGRNGVEYSVLLIGCLAAVAYAHWARR
jgi:putative oxidoreductase